MCSNRIARPVERDSRDVIAHLELHEMVGHGDALVRLHCQSMPNS